MFFIQLLNSDGSKNGAAVSAASLGIEDFEYEKANLSPHAWTFTVGGRELDASDLWPYGQLLAIQDDAGNRLAFGRITPWRRSAAQATQNHIGRLVNPWWYLTRIVYQQRYNVIIGNYPNAGQITPDPTYKVFTTPRVVLNILFDGQSGFYSATTGQQIADAVNWAILKGAPIALGTVDPSTLPFSDFQKGIFCSDVINLMYRKEPDFVVHWDYSTLPFPTVHFLKPGKGLNPITIDLTDAVRREQVEINERPDWQRSYVNICYDQVNQQNGATFLNILNDLYPDPIPAGVEAAFNGVDLYCDLAGSAQNSTSQSVQIASLPVDITSLDTWKRWKPDLAAGTIAAVTILTGNQADANRPAPALVPRDELDANGAAAPLDPACQYELVDGEWADWTGIKGQRVRATAWAKIILKNGTTKYEQLHAEPTLVSFNTAGRSKNYTQGSSKYTSFAEPIPQGLAKAMWESWQNLCIEGSFTNVEAVVGTQAVSLATSLNFLTKDPGTNGRPDWQNVEAIVQRISGSFLKGTSKVEFGAPLGITGNELVDAVRATRYRVTTVDLGYLFGGALGGGSAQVALGRKTHARAAHHGATHTEVHSVSGAVAPAAGDAIVQTNGTTAVSSWTPPNGPGGPAVVLDPAKAKGSDGKWHALSIVEKKECINENGTLKERTVLVLASEPFKGAGDPD